ncbi:MAG: metallophosphoesterase [Sulfolobaceae archaeon]
MIELVNGFYIEGDMPVVYNKVLNSIILSDAHIGFEEEMTRKGIFLPRIQKKKFLDVVEKAIDVFKTNKIIINGDLKHRLDGIGKQEKKDLEDVFMILRDKGVEIKLVKGNHDNYISIVTSKFDNVELVEYIEYENIVITHGHKEITPEQGKLYVIGHEHPRISLKDRLGFARRFPCFFITPLKNNSLLLVLPAVGGYQAGSDITLSHSAYMSNLMREHSILEEAKPYIIIEGEGIMELPKLKFLKDLIT